MKNINKKLVQETKILLKGQQPDANYIWKCLDQSDQTQTNVYYFCLKIFQALINSQKKIEFSQNYEAMLSTLLVLEFYKNMKEKPESLITDSKKLFSQNHMKLYGHAQWVVDLFLKNSEEASFAKEFISRLCHAPKKISWKVQPGRQFQDVIQSAQIYSRQLQLQKLKSEKPHKLLKYVSYPQSFFQSKILAFGYICFIDYLRSSNYEVIKQIYEHMLDLLKGFVHAARVTTKATQLCINYLFLLKSLLTLYGCQYDEILKQMIYLVDIIRGFPGIIGNFAHQIFDIIHGQLKTKGTAFRKKIRSDYPTIDIKNADSLSKRVTLLSFQPPIFNTSESILLNNLRRLIVYNMISCIDPQNVAKVWKNIESIDSQNIYKLYYKLAKIVDLTQGLENYQQLQKMQKQSINQLFRYNPFVKGKVPKDENEELGDLVNHEHQYKFFSYPIPEITQVKYENFQNKKHMNSIYQLFENLKIGNNQLFYQNKVSIAMFGDDYEVNRWIKQIVLAMEEMPIFLLQKLEIFLIPTKKFSCSLAQYIASKDLWYKRFVYYVFKQKVLFPDIEIDEESKDLFPTYLFTKSLQMYIREADRTFPIQVYKCLLKLKDFEQEQIVYFCSSILIGTSAEIQILKNHEKQKNKKQMPSDSIDLYIEKIKKPAVYTVDIQLSYKQAFTNQTVKRTQKQMNIQDLQICNTPRQYFMGNVPDPSDRFLQLSILTQKMGKSYRKQLQNKQTFKRNNEHQIRQVFKDLFINLTTDFISIESTAQNQSLKLVIDGAAINKVEKIFIVPMQNKDKYPIRLPIKTFLPFEI